MYGKTVRRRRALLLALVVLALILLTVYFGESPDGGLHSVQRGFLTVVSPIQHGANIALKPVRSVIDWFGEVGSAKGERDHYRQEAARLRAKVIADETMKREYEQMRGILHVERANALEKYKPVSANVIAQSTLAWYQTVNIDKGSADGIAVNDPVINGEGLVGKVTQVTSDAAQVSLITDSAVGVSARIASGGAPGLIQPKVGDPSDLLLQYVPMNANVQKGDLVVTSGTIVSADESLFPPGIEIGAVTSVNEESPYESVNVRPAVDLQALEVVRVLTQGPGSRLSRVSSAAARLGLKGSGSAQAGAPPGSSYAQAGK